MVTAKCFCSFHFIYFINSIYKCPQIKGIEDQLAQIVSEFDTKTSASTLWEAQGIESADQKKIASLIKKKLNFINSETLTKKGEEEKGINKETL